MTNEQPSAGDPIPPKCAVIEVQVSELKQLFNSIDPSPFRDKDLDPRAEEFIVGWAKDLPSDTLLALQIDLDRPAGVPDEALVLRDAVHEFFRQRALATRRKLRELFQIGRTSLAVGLVALAGAIALGDFLGNCWEVVSARSLAKASPSAAGSQCGVHWRSFYMTGGRFVMKLDSTIALQRCRCASGI